MLARRSIQPSEYPLPPQRIPIAAKKWYITAAMVYHDGERQRKEDPVLPAPPVAGQALYSEAKRLIPGGAQLLSKRPEMFAPGQWPPYYTTASGCEIIDVDGRRFVDMSMMGIGACLLGYN